MTRYARILSVCLILGHFTTEAYSQTNNILETELGTYPFSAHRGGTCTPDGEYLYLAEGGGIAICDTTDSNGDPDQTGIEDEIKRPTVGRRGAMPARLLLDPDAADPPAEGANDLLYLACGRDGFWAMGADVGGGSNFATRIDDSGNLNPATQNGRRWCVEVDWFELGGVQYVAALFQKVDQNRLRIYKLGDVRTAYATAKQNDTETGEELAPLVQVKLDKHPSPGTTYGPPKDPLTWSGALALGMDVDVLGANEVDIYVAMGPHGLAKVSLGPTMFAIPPVVSPSADWGPVFGDGTHYAVNVHARYDNYDLTLSNDVTERSEAPVFSDVVVQNDTNGHYLYAAVGHLNWVRFDLENQSWSDTMPIDHQEGKDLPNGWDEDQMRLVPTYTGDPSNDYAYTRLLEIVEHDTHGPVLAATAHRNPFWKGNLQYTEGPPYDTNAEGGSFSANAPGSHRTVLYRLTDTFVDLDYNMDAWVEFGGRTLVVPPDQKDSDRVELFHHLGVDNKGALNGFAATGTCKLGVELVPVGQTAQAPADPDPPPTTGDWVIVRDVNQTFGANCYSIDFCEDRKELIFLSGNDAGAEHDGFLVTTTNANGVDFEVKDQLPDEKEDSYVLPLLAKDVGQWTNPNNTNEIITWGDRVNTDVNHGQQQWTANVVDVLTVSPESGPHVTGDLRIEHRRSTRCGRAGSPKSRSSRS